MRAALLPPGATTAALLGSVALIVIAASATAQTGDEEGPPFAVYFYDMAMEPAQDAPDGAPVPPWPSVDVGAQRETWTAVPRNMVVPESGYREEDVGLGRHLHFDGVDDVVVIEPATVAEPAMSISLSVRATPTGAYAVLSTFVLEAPGAAEPRHVKELAIDDEGRLAFSVDPQRGGPSLILPEPIADGEWRHVSATLLPRPGFDGDEVEMGLAVDGGQALRRTWDADTEPTFVGQPGSYHIGGVATADGTLDPFAGDIGWISIDHLGGAAAAGSSDAPASDAEEMASGTARASIEAKPSSTSEGVRFRLQLEDAGDAQVVAVDASGAEHDLGGGWREISWDAPEAGLYRFEAREPAPDGSYAVVASDSALAMPAPRPPGEIAAAVVAATAIVAVSAALSSRGIDLWNILRGVALNRAQGRFHAATKETRLEKRVRLGSIAAALIAVVLMSLILTAGRRLENVVQGVFIAAFLVAGLAAIAFSLATTGAQAGIARAERATPRYRLWLAGAFSLAVSTIAFGIPFGFAGNLTRDPAPGAPPETPRRRALAAIVAICVGVGAAPLFLAIGAFTRFAFAEIAVAMALGGVFVSALPLRPLPGRAVWAWSKPASLTLLAATFLLQSAYHLGRLSAWAMVAVGIAALLVAVALTVVRARGGRDARGTTRRRTRAAPPSGGA